MIAFETSVPDRIDLLIVSPQFPSPALPLNGVGESGQIAHLAALGIRTRIVVPLPTFHSPLHGRVWSVPAQERTGGAPVVHPRFVGLPPQLVNRGYLKHLERALYQRALRAELAAFRSSTGRKILLVHSCVTAGHALLRLRGSVPFVVTVHDSDLQTAAARPRLRPIIAEVLTAADHVVYQSTKLQRLGEELVGPHAGSVIPWGVETYPDLAHEEPEAFTVCSVCRLVPTKGIDLLLRAFAQLVPSVPDARLVLVGDGPERPTLEALGRTLGISDRVTFTGRLPNRGARQEVARCSAFVLPSYVEALGVAYLEAMSLGVPAVGVEGQGISDLIVDGENGLLVPAHDVESLHSAMLRIASNADERRRLSRAGRRTFAERRLDWRGNAERHVELFERILGP